MRRPKPRTGNRSDVPQPLTTPTGLPYGEAGALQQAQAAVPLARQTTPSAPGPGTPTPPSGGVDFASVLAGAQSIVPPENALNAPTTRPDEHVMTGAGDPMSAPPPQMMGTLSQTLNQIAMKSGSADLALLARIAEGAGQ